MRKRKEIPTNLTFVIVVVCTLLCLPTTWYNSARRSVRILRSSFEIVNKTEFPNQEAESNLVCLFVCFDGRLYGVNQADISLYFWQFSTKWERVAIILQQVFLLLSASIKTQTLAFLFLSSELGANFGASGI